MLALRGYQSEAVQRVSAAWQTHRSVLLVAPTGSGKTAMGAALAYNAVLDGGRVLWLAHRDELIIQASMSLKHAIGSADVGTLLASKHIGADAVVQVCSVGTLLARGQRPAADLVIVDEAHHVATTTMRDLLSAYGNARVLGLTATPQRGDGKALSEFGSMVVAATPRELETQGYIVPMAVIAPKRLLRPGQIAQRPVDAWRAHANGRQAIVFCSSVKHAWVLADEFGGDMATVIDGTTAADRRSKVLADYNSGHTRVLCNVGVLTEGFDAPVTSCIILARGCGSVGLYMQICGRGSRPAPGKTDCVLIDLRGVSHVHGHPYQDREYSLEGAGIGRPVERPDQSYCRVCGAPIETGEGCDDCGIGPNERPVKVVNSPLVKFAAIRRRSLEEKKAHWDRLVAQCRVRGWKTGRAYYTYRAAYGEEPPT